MATYTQNFVGTPGTNLTAGNSGGGGSDAYSLVNPTNSAGVTFSDAKANPITGGTVGRFAAAAGVAAEVRYNTADVTSGAVQMVVMFSDHVSGMDMDLVINRGTVQNGGVRYRPSGTELRPVSVSSVTGTVGTTPPLNEWLVLDVLTVEGASTTDGRLAVRLRRLDDLATTLLSEDYTDRNVGVSDTDVINSFRAGKITTATAVLPEMWVAQHRVESGATTFLSDPVPLSVEPVAAHERSVTQTLDFSTSSNAASLAVDQVSGPAVTVDVAGMVASFEDPVGRTENVVLDCTVTGPGGSDVERVTVPPGAGAVVEVVRRVGTLIRLGGELV